MGAATQSHLETSASRRKRQSSALGYGRCVTVTSTRIPDALHSSSGWCKVANSAHQQIVLVRHGLPCAWQPSAFTIAAAAWTTYGMHKVLHNVCTFVCIAAGFCRHATEPWGMAAAEASVLCQLGSTTCSCGASSTFQGHVVVTTLQNASCHAHAKTHVVCNTDSDERVQYCCLLHRIGHHSHTSCGMVAKCRCLDSHFNVPSACRSL